MCSPCSGRSEQREVGRCATATRRDGGGNWACVRLCVGAKRGRFAIGRKEGRNDGLRLRRVHTQSARLGTYGTQQAHDVQRTAEQT
jgi:hypothetical protein